MSLKDNNVAIIIPVRNGEKFINESMESLIYGNNEKYINTLIVVNDGSTDHTSEVIDEVIKEYRGSKGIFHFRTLPHNQYAAKNYALAHLFKLISSCYKEMMNIEFIGFQDADDIAYLSRLEEQLKVLEDEKVWAVGSCFRNIKEDGNLLDDKEIAWPLEANPLLKGQRAFGVGLSNATALYRKEIFDYLGAFDYTPTMGDTEFFMRLVWLSLLKEREIKNIQKPLLYRRIHRNQVSKNQQKTSNPYRNYYEHKLKGEFNFYKGLWKDKILEVNYLYKPNPYRDTGYIGKK